MSSNQIAFYREKLKRFGRWVGVRYLRNRGVSFDQAYYIMFNRLPRLQYR